MCPAINAPHLTTRRSGRYGPPRARGSGGALGKEGEEGLSGLPGDVAPWLGLAADGRLQLQLPFARRDTQMAFGGLGLEMITAEDARRGLGLSQR